MAVLLQVFSPTVGKSKCSHVSSEISHFITRKNPGHDVRNQIFPDIGMGLCKTHKAGTVPGQQGRMRSPPVHQEVDYELKIETEENY
jgi:hypothetical protein